MRLSIVGTQKEGRDQEEDRAEEEDRRKEVNSSASSTIRELFENKTHRTLRTTSQPTGFSKIHPAFKDIDTCSFAEKICEHC